MDHDMLGESHLLGIPWGSSGSPPLHWPGSYTAGRSSRSQHRPWNLQNKKEVSVPGQNVSLSRSQITDCNQPSFYSRTLCCCGVIHFQKCCRSRFHQIPEQVFSIHSWQLDCEPWLWWSALERCPVFFQPNKQVQSSTLASDCEVQSVTLAIIISVLPGFQAERFLHSSFLAMSTYVSFKHEPTSIFWCQSEKKIQTYLISQ